MTGGEAYKQKLLTDDAPLTELAASTLARKQRELEQDLDASLKAPATGDLARTLQARMRQARDQLLTFVAFPGPVDATNNACERNLRPAVGRDGATQILGRCITLWQAGFDQGLQLDPLCVR